LHAQHAKLCHVLLEIEYYAYSFVCNFYTAKQNISHSASKSNVTSYGCEGGVDKEFWGETAEFVGRFSNIF
jgi:hypothetical protein